MLKAGEKHTLLRSSATHSMVWECALGNQTVSVNCVGKNATGVVSGSMSIVADLLVQMVQEKHEKLTRQVKLFSALPEEAPPSRVGTLSFSAVEGSHKAECCSQSQQGRKQSWHPSTKTKQKHSCNNRAAHKRAHCDASCDSCLTQDHI